MTASTHLLMSAFALAAHGSVASSLDASVPAIVLGDDCRTLRFVNAAAAHVLDISTVRPVLGQPAPLDEAVCRHLARVAANGVIGRQSTERIRYYRGIKPIVLTLVVEPLGIVDGEPALLIMLPELARPTADNSLQTTLALYAGPDELLTAFGADDVLAVAGNPAVLDEAPSEIEAIAGRMADGPTEATYVATPRGQRIVQVVRMPVGLAVRRLMYVGASEPMPLAVVQEAVTVEPVETELPLEQELVFAPATPALTITTSQALPAEVAVSFAFAPQVKPQRFGWELDGSMRFAAIGPEFAASLGSAAAPRIGESWDKVASRLAIDEDGKIGGLLGRRQPWHGQTIDWPVEGTALRVPVTLTAMPLADAEHQFAGFRGFGIIRSGDAVADPQETGLHLAASPIVTEAETVETVSAVMPDGIEPTAEETHIVEAPQDVFVVVEPASIIRNDAHSHVRHPEPVPDLVPGPLLPLEDELPPIVLEPLTTGDAHFVTLMPAAHISPETLRLTGAERNAFRQIAEALGARFAGDDDLMAVEPPAEPANPIGGGIDSSIRMLSTLELLDELNRPAGGQTPIELPQASERRRTGTSDSSTRLIDRLPIAVALTRDEAIIHVNPTFLTLTGYEDLDDLNRAGGLDVLFAGPHAAKGWADDRNRRHIPLVTQTGRVVPVDARIASVPWGGATALLITLISPDRPGMSLPASVPNTDDEALEAAEDRIGKLEAMLSAASDGVVMLSADGRVLSADAPAETLFGASPGSMSGMRLADLMALESQRAATDYIDGLARNGIGSLLLEGRELIGQVGDRRIQLFATIVKVSGAPEPRFAAVFRDISRLKTSEEELMTARRRAEDASAQKSDFLARISHDIRTPLNAIIGFSEVMLGERFGAIGVERYKDYLRDILSSGTHIMSLINDLLDLSKAEAGKLDLKFESIQLADVLAECVQLMQPQASRERVIIRASLTQGLPPVVADYRSVRQIVLNLLTNAIRFTPAGGQVIVSAALEDTNEVVVRVRDTGYGMSPGDIEIALEPFRQPNTARSRSSGASAGMGFGLPLTKALIEANRAALKIDSAVNQGTLVQITFPAPRVLAAE